MLKEAIERLVELGAKTKAVQITPCPGDPNITLQFMPDGTVQERVHEAPARRHSVSDIASLHSALNHYGAAKSAIWVCFGEVVIVLDDDSYRASRITLKLVESPIFSAIQNFGKSEVGGKVSDPKKLYRFLKHDCNGASIDPPDLDLLISNLKFRTEDELTREVGKTADKMGQSIRSEVTGADKIPDLVTFEFLPWPGIEEEYQDPVSVPCQLYIDPAERSISLKPLPGMIDAAKTTATASLAKKIFENWTLGEIPVFCGIPN